MNLKVDNITFSYNGRRNIFSDISFEYNTPEIMCILGTNGTGKSTLLQCLTGENPVSTGSILVDGKPVREYSARDLARKIAYLPQSHVPSFAFKVIEVVMMGRTARMGRFSSPGREDRETAMEKLRFLNIDFLAEKSYTQISGGERQMVMIAASLAQEPDLIILDEPVSHLDFGNQYRFVNLMKQLQQTGTGVMMTTHFPDHVLQLGCRTLVLSKGGILADGNASDVITSESMSSLYGINADVTEVHGRTMCVPYE